MYFQPHMSLQYECPNLCIVSTTIPLSRNPRGTKNILLKFAKKITYLAASGYECYLNTEGRTAFVKAHICGML